MQVGQRQNSGNSSGGRAHSPSTPPYAGDRSTLEGQWVLLADNDGQLTAQDSDGRVPLMVRSGDGQTYLLAFKNAAKARAFVTSQGLDGVEARMVVRAYKDDIVRIAKSASVAGVLVDYDPESSAPAVSSDLS